MCHSSKEQFFGKFEKDTFLVTYVHFFLPNAWQWRENNLKFPETLFFIRFSRISKNHDHLSFLH